MYPSSNGTALISTMTASDYSGSTFTVNNPTLSTQTITINADVAIVGTYNIISETKNGITFSRSGSFVTPTGLKTIVLRAAGTPIAAGTFTFTTNTVPSVTFSITVEQQ
jgi:hypothetical protein